MTDSSVSRDRALVEVRPEYFEIYKAGQQIELEMWIGPNRRRLVGAIVSVLDDVIILAFDPASAVGVDVPKGTPSSLIYTTDGNCYRGECEVRSAQMLAVFKVIVSRPFQVSRTNLRDAYRYDTLLEDCALFRAEKDTPGQWIEHPWTITNISSGGALARSPDLLPVGAEAESVNYVMEVALPWDLGVLTLPLRLLGVDKGGTAQKAMWHYRVQFKDPPTASQDVIARYINRAQMELQAKGVAGTYLAGARRTGGTLIGLEGATVVRPKVVEAKREETLADVLGDSARPAVERAYSLNTAAAALARKIMLDPTPEAVREAPPFISQMVAHVTKDRELVRYLVRNLASSAGLEVHSVNVAIYTLAFGIAVGLKSTDGLEEVTTGAFLHDLGKSSIPSRVLGKAGELTYAEWELVRRHANVGRQFASRAGISDRVVLNVIQHHHERVNGSGYPDRIHDRQIPSEAGVVAIADVFDALTTDRPWRPRYSIFKALVIMRDEMSGGFDRDYLKEFIKTLGQLLSG